MEFTTGQLQRLRDAIATADDDVIDSVTGQITREFSSKQEWEAALAGLMLFGLDFLLALRNAGPEST